LKTGSWAISLIVFKSATLKYKKENPEKSLKQLILGFLCYVFVNYLIGYQVIMKSPRSPEKRKLFPQVKLNVVDENQKLKLWME
jgi:hypothetical protein